MSEPISAFSVYKANGIKKSPGSKKNKAAKKALRHEAKNTSKSNGSPIVDGRKNDDSNVKNTPKTNGAAAKKTKSANQPEAMTVSDPPNTLMAKKSQNRKSSGKALANGDDGEATMEQAQNTKKQLSKAEKKRKKQLEAQQLRQLEDENDDLAEQGAAALAVQMEVNGAAAKPTLETDDSDSQDSQTPLEPEEPAKSKKAKNNKKATKRKTIEAGTTNKNTLNENGVAQAKIMKKEATQKPQEIVSTATNVASQGAVPKQRSVTNEPQNVGNRFTNVKLEPLSPPSNITKMNSITEGLKVFRWLLNPVKVDDFYAKYWERNAGLVKRQQSSYYKQLISFEAIDQMLLKHHVEFTKNLDVTSYINGVRETLNPTGRALPPVVWDHYGRGCSIRLLNPQTFLPALFTLCTTLQEYFHCLVGANAYLTPPNSQGFAPHYDDIEAFVLQIEGRKRWKLYKPRSKAEELPRVSSRNFDQNEIGKPILEEVLSPGDILYFPRGTIHQACTEPGHHSLHITLSVYQKQSYADLFEKMMPLMLQRAIESSVELRRGLPLHTWHHAGIAFSDNDTQERQQLVQTVSQLLTKCLREAPVSEMMDAAVDQLAKKYQHEALPPEILPSERARTMFGSKSTTDEQGECICDYEIDLRTNVRLLRANIMRLVHEEQKIRLYYYLNNSKEYCEYEANYIEIDSEDAGSVEVLIKSYPAYVSVSQLPIEDDERKISMVTALWENGLLMLEKPLH